MPAPSSKRPLKRPRDSIALAKLIGDIATGQVEDRTLDDGRNPAAVAFKQCDALDLEKFT
jgi:hypothetical protein